MADSDIQSFSTSVKTNTDAPVEFMLDDRRIEALRPKSAIFGETIHGLTSSKSVSDQVINAIRFLEGCLKPADRDWIAKRLRDPDDDLDVEEVMEIINFLMTEFSGRPTESQSG